MQFLIPVFFLLFGATETLEINVPADDYKVVRGELAIESDGFLTTPGMPKLPCRKLTLALPPGAMVKSVRFHGTRQEVCKLDIPFAEPVIPLSGGRDLQQALQFHEVQNQASLRSDRALPETLGALVTKGGLRKYTLIRLACHHFAYQPSTRTLYHAPNIRIEVDYDLPKAGSDRHRHFDRLKNDVTFDKMAEELIDNWNEAKAWYAAPKGVRAKGYWIILPSFLQSSVTTLVQHRESQGYDVNVVTREYIDINGTGADLQEKIRNHLRENVADIEFVLLVGGYTHVPWRSLVPFNNNPYSPYGSPDYSPIPGDIYYGELTDPDHISWNSDGDEYYGEVYTNNMVPNGNDDPDYFADVHVGRIPFSTYSYITDICAKTIAFDTNKDLSYKKSALLAGSIYYFANENNTGNDRMDGADFIEDLMNDGVVDRTNSVYMYEVDGINPCVHSCIVPLTQANTILNWQHKGIMYECHHGSNNMYARKVWGWDDGDGVPENNEIQWPTCLEKSDVHQLDNTYPATTFLRSCLCGKPEVNGLGAMLLYRGASAVVASSRVAWMSPSDSGGIPQHFYDRLLNNLFSSHGLMGKAHDLAKIEFMNNTGFWLPIYHYNLFGDPALRQLGRIHDLQPEPVGAKIP